MTNEEYRDILAFTRQIINQSGFGSIDERIMSDIHGSDGAFWDLMYYLKYLTEEMALGTDDQLANVLRRFRRYVKTESGDDIAGVRIAVSEEDRERYGVDYIDFSETSKLDGIVQDLKELTEKLNEDYRRNSNQ